MWVLLHTTLIEVLHVGPHISKVVRYGYKSIACGSICPRCVGVKIASGVARGSICSKGGSYIPI